MRSTASIRSPSLEPHARAMSGSTIGSGPSVPCEAGAAGRDALSVTNAACRANAWGSPRRPPPGPPGPSARRRRPSLGRGALGSGASGSLSISNSRPPVIGVASRRRTSHAAPRAASAAGALADQGVGAVVVDEVFVAQAGDRHQPVGAGLVQAHEQAEAGDPGDAALERPRRRGRPERRRRSGRWRRARRPWRAARPAVMCSAVSFRRATS